MEFGGCDDNFLKAIVITRLLFTSMIVSRILLGFLNASLR